MADDESFLSRIDRKISEVVEAFSKGDAEHQFDLAELQLRIRLTGPAWAGLVDKPVAKFLVDLDAMLTDELQQLGVAIPESKHGLVALQIQEGSMDAWLKYSKEILGGFSKLKPYQQILVVCTILGALGLLNSDKIIHSLNEAKLAKIIAEQEEARGRERVELVKEIGRIKDHEHQLQAPVRSLANKMTSADRMQLPGQTKALKKEEVKEALTPATRSKTDQYYIDHPYKVDSLNTKDPEHWKIGLSFGDVSFSADVLLSKEEMASLLKDFQEAHAKNSAIAPAMHVTAKVSEKGVTSAKVVGLGDPRVTARRLSEVLANAKQAAAGE